MAERSLGRFDHWGRNRVGLFVVMYDVWLFGIKCHLVVRTWSKDALSKGHHTGIMMASQMKHCPRYLFIGIEFTYVILVCVGLMWCFPMFDQHRGFANHSLTHSPSHSPSHSLTKSPTHQLTNSFHNSTTHCLTYSLTHKRFPSLQVLDVGYILHRDCPCIPFLKYGLIKRDLEWMRKVNPAF